MPHPATFDCFVAADNAFELASGIDTTCRWQGNAVVRARIQAAYDLGRLLEPWYAINTLVSLAAAGDGTKPAHGRGRTTATMRNVQHCMPRSCLLLQFAMLNIVCLKALFAGIPLPRRCDEVQMPDLNVQVLSAQLSPVYAPVYIFSAWRRGAKLRTFVSGSVRHSHMHGYVRPHS